MIKTIPGKFVVGQTKYRGIIGNQQVAPAFEVEYHDTNTKLLLHGESIADSSMYNVPLTNSGVTVSTAQSKFGGKSLYFNGSSRILFPQSAIIFGANDFTIDWWEYWTTTPSGVNGTRFSSAYTANSSFGGLLAGYRSTNIYASTSLSSRWDLLSGEPMLSTTVNQWVHWAIVRNGGALYTYRNGTLFASRALNGPLGYSELVPMAIGDYRQGDHSYFTGYIDEFRISDIARWTSNFTPPTEPYEV